MLFLFMTIVSMSLFLNSNINEFIKKSNQFVAGLYIINFIYIYNLTDFILKYYF